MAGSYPNPTIAPNAVAGAKVADDSLTGADLVEATLGTVPNAANAGNADNLGGNPWWQHQQICTAGAVHGFVYVPAHNTFSAEWTQLPGFNCKGGQILARRINGQVYHVVFQGNPAVFPLATSTGCGIGRVARRSDGSFEVYGLCFTDDPFYLVLI